MDVKGAQALADRIAEAAKNVVAGLPGRLTEKTLGDQRSLEAAFPSGPRSNPHR